MQETILRAGLDVCYTWRSLEEAPLSKRPSFQFYPGDWRRDTSLQSCSLYARGLWHELLCLAHDGDPYGHLSVAGTPLTSIQIARMVGEPLEPVEAAIAELERAGVTSRSESGALYCRRMVRDERLRDVRAQAGRLGGNPILLNQTLNQTVKQMDNLTANQTPTPASASASASARLHY